MNPPDDIALWQDHPLATYHLFSIIKKSKSYRKALFPKLHHSSPNADLRPFFKVICLKLIVRDDEWREFSLEKGWVTQTDDGGWATNNRWDEEGYLHLSNAIDFFKHRMEYGWYASQYGINPTWTAFKDIPNKDMRKNLKRNYPYYFILLELHRRGAVASHFAALLNNDNNVDMEAPYEEEAQTSDQEDQEDNEISSDESPESTPPQSLIPKTTKVRYRDRLVHHKRFENKKSQDLLATFIGEKNITQTYLRHMVDRHAKKRMNLSPLLFSNRFKLECGLAGFIKTPKESRSGRPLQAVEILVLPNYKQDSVAEDIVDVLKSAGALIHTDPSILIIDSQKEQYFLSKFRCQPSQTQSTNVHNLPLITLEGCLTMVLDGYGINPSPRMELEDALEQAVTDAQNRTSTVGSGIGVRIAPAISPVIKAQLEYVIHRENFTLYRKHKLLLNHPAAQGRIVISVDAQHRGLNPPTAISTKVYSMTPLLFTKFVESRRGSVGNGGATGGGNTGANGSANGSYHLGLVH